MKRLFSYLLLLSFITLSAPRDWVHECEHDEHIHHADLGDHDSASFDAEDCYACDYSLSSYSLHSFAEFSFDGAHYFKNDFSKVNGPLADFNVTHSLRGPPSIELS